MLLISQKYNVFCVVCQRMLSVNSRVAWRQGDSTRVEETGGIVNCQTQSIKVHVQHDAISIEALNIWASQPEAGAVSSFLGVTRNNFNGIEVIRLEYEGYVPMAEKVLRGIARQVFTKWKGICRVAIVHRLGVVPVSEASVAVVVSSPHRRDSLEAVHFAIDQVKALVPIWKKEVYGNNTEIIENTSSSEANMDVPQWKTNKEWNAAEAADFSQMSM